MFGDGRQGVLGDGVNDGDDGETHHEADHQGVALDVGADNEPRGSKPIA